MLINARKIKGRTVEMGLTQTDVAKRIGITKPTLWRKLNGKSKMYLDEAEIIADILQIEDDSFCEYFFAQNVAKRN